jgi:hypothetical protein
MTIAAKISSAELTAQVTNRFANQYFEVALFYAPGTNYQPGITNDTTFKTFEVTSGTAGYIRKIIKYETGDISAYTDDGVALAAKVAIFSHDGSLTNIDFSHVVLLRGNGNILTLGSKTAKPTSGINGTYTNLPVITTGSGKGLTVNLTVDGSGGALSNWTLTIVNAGYGYTAGDILQIQSSDLYTAGAIPSGAGSLAFSAGTVTTGGGQIVSVAQTPSAVSLNNGNQAAFYFNIKQFGFYSV